MSNPATVDLNICEDNQFIIGGEFDDTIVSKIIPGLIKAIRTQEAMKNGILKFTIESPGGSTTKLYNLLGYIEMAKKKGITVETTVFGGAYSCGSILACSGTKGHRLVGHYAEHLCHLGSGSAYGTNPIELERSTERVRQHFSRVKSLYRTYAKVKNLDSVINDDQHYIRGQDILDNGLADRFID